MTSAMPTAMTMEGETPRAASPSRRDPTPTPADRKMITASSMPNSSTAGRAKFFDMSQMSRKMVISKKRSPSVRLKATTLLLPSPRKGRNSKALISRTTGVR